MEEKNMKKQTLEQQNQENQNEQTVIVPVEEKKERRSNKRILLLLMLLLVTGVMLSTSTYAWFTSNRTVTVEDIDVNVAASGGIQISVDGTSWKSIITHQDLLDAHTTYTAATNQIPSILKPVSTAAKSLNNGYLSMWLGTVTNSETDANKGEYILSTADVSTVNDNSASAEGTGSNGHFVMFDLFVRLDDNGSEAKPLYLTDGSNVVFKSGGSDLGTQNASRVAFINEGNKTTGSDLADIQALTTTNVSDIYLWEPNYDVHTATGIANAYSYYNSAEQGNAYTAANANSQVPYFGTIGEVQIADDVLLSKTNATDNATKFASVVPGITTTAAWADGTEYKELFNLTPNTVSKVRIYFWIEGQDIDCENRASGGDITLKLQFSLNEGEEATS